MAESLGEEFARRLPARNATDPKYVPDLVDALLAAARAAHATDVHLIPCASGMSMHWRIDGVLHRVADFPAVLSPKIAARLKVLAELLTYRTDVPQEGGLLGGSDAETRVSTFPTLFGEKIVVRLFVGAGTCRRLNELGLPEEVRERLQVLLNETSGVIVLTGPAGSGKTTTIYAALRELVDKSGGGRSLVSLEDPIEVVVPGVAQSQVRRDSEFNMETGLRSLLRQDPEVIMVGEIRDRATAETVFQASLTGHLVLTTFHAGSAAQAVSRLSDMGIEPYLLRSGVLGIVSQRLVRRLCSCAIESTRADDRLGLEAPRVLLPAGCERCAGAGYRDRMVLAEMLIPNLKELGRAILSRNDAAEIEQLALQTGFVSLWNRGCAAVAAGLTSPAEVRRVLGFR